MEVKMEYREEGRDEKKELSLEKGFRKGIMKSRLPEVCRGRKPPGSHAPAPGNGSSVEPECANKYLWSWSLKAA